MAALDTPAMLVVTSAILTPILTLLTLMWKDRQVRLREVRNRQWDIEDRALLAKNVLATAQVQATQFAEHIALVRDDISVNTEKTTQAIGAADKAYTEANHVNIKIENLQQRLLANEMTQPRVVAVGTL